MPLESFVSGKYITVNPDRTVSLSKVQFVIIAVLSALSCFVASRNQSVPASSLTLEHSALGVAASAKLSGEATKTRFWHLFTRLLPSGSIYSSSLARAIQSLACSRAYQSSTCFTGHQEIVERFYLPSAVTLNCPEVNVLLCCASCLR